MKTVSSKKTYFILVWSALFLPCSVFASTVYLDTSHSDFFVGDTVMVNVRIDSENKNINAVEGNVLLDYSPESASLIDINTSGSTFSLWPGKPLPSASNTSISFAGGSPGGLLSKDAIVFNIVLKLQKAGKVTLTPNDLSVYLNDGKGTKDEVRGKNVVIDVLPQKTDSESIDDWSGVILNDTTPPEPFKIYLGQEGSVFDGKKFLSFNAIDEQSGIAYYEVMENDLPQVRSGTTYVLQEQDKPVKATVIAYDSAGNSRKSTYSSAPYTISYPVIILLVVLILGWIAYKKRKRSLK
ncbi:MAG: hypothetical protein RLY47_504 [Candidatus Parcubacteria bacterium]